MTHWKNVAASLDPPVPAEDAERIAPVLEALEQSFRPLVRSIPQGADVWTAPE